MKYLITGGAGFIGSNFVKYMINKYPNPLNSLLKVWVLNILTITLSPLLYYTI